MWVNNNGEESMLMIVQTYVYRMYMCLDDKAYLAVSFELLLLFFEILIHGHQRSKLLQHPIDKKKYVKVGERDH